MIGVELLPTGLHQVVVLGTMGEGESIIQNTEKNVKNNVRNTLFDQRRTSFLGILASMLDAGIISQEEYDAGEATKDNITLAEILEKKGHIFTDSW